MGLPENREDSIGLDEALRKNVGILCVPVG